MFEQVIQELVSPAARPLDGYSRAAVHRGAPFDLLTFPEAFAPATALLTVLRSIGRLTAFGCVHVGLRPDEHHHLFGSDELKAFVTELASIPELVQDDIAVFRSWLEKQTANCRFNIGCLFTLDANARLRLCLHPKLVRSRYEHSPLQEENMDEANLLSLVTLLPSEKKFMSITIQPLICSDALNLQTDRGTPPPIRAISGPENPFHHPPDHIDLVSIATHTPQVLCEKDRPDGGWREWHQDFRDAFCCAAGGGDHPRHHFATFILSNFETLDGGSLGGLSGVFQPIDPHEIRFHDAISLSCYGSLKKGGNNTWWSPGKANAEDWKWRGYLAALTPSSGSETAARVFSFTLANMLRDASPWKSSRSPSSCGVLVARWSSAKQLAFSDWGDRGDG